SYVLVDFDCAGQRETAELSFDPLGRSCWNLMRGPGHHLRSPSRCRMSRASRAIPLRTSLSYRFASLFLRLGLTAPQQALNSASAVDPAGDDAGRYDRDIAGVRRCRRMSAGRLRR
ncbi:MAG: hypothetical protein U5M50_16060, partial [Sphingobium sp.]|nr:hypothetical protein [Sphingobium sp.]